MEKQMLRRGDRIFVMGFDEIYQVGYFAIGDKRYLVLISANTGHYFDTPFEIPQHEKFNCERDLVDPEDLGMSDVFTLVGRVPEMFLTALPR